MFFLKRSFLIKNKWIYLIICAMAFFLWGRAAFSVSMRFYPLSHRLTGGDVHYTVKKGDTLGLIASHYGLERTDLAIQTHTNPSFKVAHIWVGEVLKFSNRHIVPYSMSNGLLLNVAQRMLFDFKDGQLLEAYPFAAGVPTWPTPIGMFHITSKVAFPVWYVPKNIQEEEASEGRVVQIKVLPGPDNPLGQYWLGLSVGGIGIHGTIEPQNIYRYESHGCVRLFPSDIKKLFGQSYVGESGEIIYEPVLLAKSRDGKIWLEVDDDVYNLWPYHDLNYVKALIRKNHLEHEVSWKKVDQVVRQKLAVAENVTNRLPKEIVANKNR